MRSIMVLDDANCATYVAVVASSTRSKLVEHLLKPSTPWQRVFVKFGMTQSAFARELQRHRAKVSRALKDDEGLINGRDQKRLITIAKKLNVELTARDLMPGRR